VISQFDVELFPEVTGVGPEQGWVSLLLPVAPADIFGYREDPGNDGKISGFSALPEGQVEEFLRSIVEPSDDLFILLEKWILSRSKSNQRGTPVLSPIRFPAVCRALPDEFKDSPFNSFLGILRK